MDVFAVNQLKPNTHRRRRRDETALSRRVGVGGVYMNSRRLPTDSNAQHSLQFCSQWVTTADGCVHTDDTTKLSQTSCEFVYTPPTRRDSTVSSRRRRRCVLGFSVDICNLIAANRLRCQLFQGNTNLGILATFLPLIVSPILNVHKTWQFTFDDLDLNILMNSNQFHVL